MKKLILLLFLQLSAIVCFADEYKDPLSNVIYTYNPIGNRAEVKAGEDWIDTDDGSNGVGTPGSPDATAEIIILDKFFVGGKEYFVDQIGECAFLYTKIVSVTIPSSIKHIGYKAFSGCSSLSNVLLKKGLISIEGLAFHDCTSLKQISLPEGLETIRWGAFMGSGLESITLPATVQAIETGAFSCQGMKAITSLIEKPFAVQDICTSSVMKQITLYVPDGTKTKYEETSGWSQFKIIEGHQLTTAYQHSAFTLFNALAQQETDNVCFSPLSVQMALSMVQNGAAGNTLLQLQQALGTEGFNNEEIGAFNNELTQSLTTRYPFIEEEYQFYDNPQEIYDGMYPLCELANGLWTRPDVQLYDDFIQALRTNYDASVDAVAFDTWEGITKINEWASEKTHHLIPKIYDEPLSSALAVVLANALYFKGSWSIPFAPENTGKGDFLLNDNMYVTVDMMLSHDRYDYAQTPSFQTITLYYGAERRFSMTLFIPLEGTALPPLTFEDWNAARKCTNLHINLYMPRFEITGSYDLIDVLKGLGVKDAFSLEADFTKMCKINYNISRVSQLSKIQVDEEGTEAAAITVTEMTESIDLTKPEDYQDFRVDRPFYFTIQSQKDQAILFAGRVTKLDGPVQLLNSISATNALDPSAKSKCYDLAGRRLSTQPAKGIYVKDGRKVVK